MKRKILTSLVITTVLLPAQSVFAADSNFYLLGSLGLTDTSGRKDQIDNVLTNLGVTAFTSSADEKDRGLSLRLGYRLNNHFAIEGGYMDLGGYSYAATATTPVATRYAKGQIDAGYLAAVGSYPVNSRLSLQAKLGVAAYRFDSQCSGTGISCGNTQRDANGASLLYGVGLEWQLDKSWFLRGEYEVIRNVGENLNTTGSTGTTRDDVKMGSIGIGYRF